MTAEKDVVEIKVKMDSWQALQDVTLKLKGLTALVRSYRGCVEEDFITLSPGEKDAAENFLTEAQSFLAGEIDSIVSNM